MLDKNTTPHQDAQLTKEIALVEKIIMVLSTEGSFGVANKLSLQFMQTQKTNTFSSIDINEYVLYLHDVERYRKFGRQAEMQQSENNAAELLNSIQEQLKLAKILLSS